MDHASALDASALDALTAATLLQEEEARCAADLEELMQQQALAQADDEEALRQQQLEEKEEARLANEQGEAAPIHREGRDGHDDTGLIINERGK